MTVHIVADSDVKLSALRAMLQNHHVVTSELVGGAGRPCSKSDAVVVTADLRVVENIAALKEMFGKFTDIPKRIFLIDQKARLFTVQPLPLGATQAVLTPADKVALLPTL